MLTVGRRLGVDPFDGAVRRRRRSSRRSARARRCESGEIRGARSISASSAASWRAGLLVRLDPGRRRTRVAQHPVGHRPLAGGRVVLDRQALALVRQIVERALPPSPRGSGARRGSPSVGADCGRALGIASLRTHGRDRSATATGKLTRSAATVRTCRRIDGRPVYSATDLVGLPRLRAPDPARAGRAGRARQAADARGPGARHHPQARLRARGAVTSPTSGPTDGRSSTIEPDGSIADRGERAAGRGRR